MKNILITSAGKRVALTRYFKETLTKYFPQGKVYTTDMNPEMAPAAYVSDGCFKVPRVTDAAYPELLLNICEENNIGMIIATIDTELLLLADLKQEFKQRGIYVMVSDKPFITLCRDKRNTGEFFEKHGVRVPAEVDKYNPTFPLFAKPYDGSLSTNLHYIKCASVHRQGGRRWRGFDFVTLIPLMKGVRGMFHWLCLSRDTPCC